LHAPPQYHNTNITHNTGVAKSIATAVTTAIAILATAIAEVAHQDCDKYFENNRF